MKGEIFVGKTRDGFPIALWDKQRSEHVQIIGSTGRGKSSSVIVPWMVQDFLSGKNVILIDGKGDRGIPEILDNWVFGDKRREVILFDLGDVETSATTNPLKFGTAAQICDRIFSTFEFENSYYRDQSYQALLMVVEMLQIASEEVSFKEIYLSLLDDGHLTELCTGIQSLAQSDKKTNQHKSETLRLALSYLAQNFNQRQEKISGLVSQLRPYATGELAILLNGEVDGKKYFSLSELVRNENKTVAKAIVILIPTLLYQKTASRLGQMFLQEIAWAIACRKTTQFLPVFLDEFSAFVYKEFIQIINKARSARVGFHLSHQSMGDLESISPDFAKAIVTNTNVKCVLGLNDPETADYFARFFGTRTSEKLTERAEKKTFGDLERSGQMSVRDVEEYRIHPNRLKRFTHGQGVLSVMVDGDAVIEEIQFEPVPEGGG